MSASLLALLFIGGGNMARAIVTGALNAHVAEAACVAIVEPDGAKRAAFEALGVRALADTPAGIAWLDACGDPRGTIVLAIKPQILPSVVPLLAPSLASRPRTVVSILAGVSTARLERELPGARVVRTMPNLPAQVARGVTAVAPGASAMSDDVELTERLFGAVGPVVVRMPEALMDAHTALAGSGPAYLFYLAESMLAAAEAMGMNAQDARAIVAETLAGASAMVAQSAADPGALRRAVTSPGGTTSAAFEVLEGANVGAALVSAILAARDRGRALNSG